MGVQDTLFSTEFTLNCRGKIFDLSTPVVMGILNITPDSFHDGGKYNSKQEAIKRTSHMLDQGARIIDVGAASSRPGASEINEQEELDRLLPILIALAKEFPETVFSVDTFHSNVAREAIEKGASIINDISGGQWDQNMFDTIVELQVPYVLMHIVGKPKNMQEYPEYENVVTEVGYYFSEKLARLKELGVNDIIIDPGFGFGKSVSHNYDLLNNLDHFQMFELPILAGISRKSMIYKTLNVSAKDSLNGTTAINMVALERGAKILRVHDVKEAFECINLFERVHSNSN